MNKGKTYSFYIDDSRIIEILDSLPPRTRSAYIRNAILYYEDVGKKLDEINEKLDKILAGNVVLQKEERAGETKKEEKSSINDLLAKSLLNFAGF